MATHLRQTVIILCNEPKIPSGLICACSEGVGNIFEITLVVHQEGNGDVLCHPACLLI